MISPDAKIVDLLKDKKDGVVPVSLEYFPPRTEEGVQVCRTTALSYLHDTHGVPLHYLCYKLHLLIMNHLTNLSSFRIIEPL